MFRGLHTKSEYRSGFLACAKPNSGTFMCIGLVGMQKHENEKNSPRDFKMAAKKHAFCWIYYLLKKNPNQLEGYVYNVNVNFMLVQSLTWVNTCL